MFKKSFVVAIMSMITVMFCFYSTVDAASLTVGSKGEQVKDLQERLYMLNYYKGSITGSYSAATKKAVMSFQGGAGLSKDGIAGPTTIYALKKVTVDRSDLSRIARVVYGEARGESFSGQVAVAAVILNRTKSSQFPNSIRNVIFEKNAFSVVNDGQFWLTPNTSAFNAAKAAAKRIDPTKGALYFYNPSVTTSSWFKSRPVTTKIGSHVFTK